jgi:hypothetical protein
MKQNKFLYYLKTRLDSGKLAWFVVAANDFIKLELLKKKIAANQPCDIRDYAEILHGGYEPAAPQEILDSVNQKYGTNFNNN